MSLTDPLNEAKNGGGGNRTRDGYAAERRNRAKQHVYFIRCGKSGPLKIGIAGDLATRLRMLQCGNHKPLHVHASQVLDAGVAQRVERLLHSRLAHSHIAGEWFKADVDVLEAARNPYAFVADAIQAQNRNAELLRG